jgi:hypothetical protein
VISAPLDVGANPGLSIVLHVEATNGATQPQVWKPPLAGPGTHEGNVALTIVRDEKGQYFIAATNLSGFAIELLFVRWQAFAG